MATIETEKKSKRQKMATINKLGVILKDTTQNKTNKQKSKTINN